tara:strand:- start:1308 stop:1535 length:228 start_codon:yes stop_codon:yes gene_type:complete
MKTLTMLPITLKKARTFGSITDIDSLKRLAQLGLVKYEGLLDQVIERAFPVRGKAYKPSRLELAMISELESSDEA